ncbi:hypothetical protein [Methylobacterium sp. WL8]|uniref:hypothetical protein n=1 Tax=Methylobacterium sp. WL8 TaxID=2603899 RepID=UPI0016507B0C|nr:hypothetical protein [Methylobacterium sp. WL8]
MSPHPLVNRGSLQAAVAALVLSRLAMSAGRLSDGLYRLAESRMRHAQALAALATGR